MSIESNLHLTGKTNCSYSTRVASKSLVEIGAYLCTDALFYLGEPPSLFLYVIANRELLWYMDLKVLFNGKGEIYLWCYNLFLLFIYIEEETNNLETVSVLS